MLIQRVDILKGKGIQSTTSCFEGYRFSFNSVLAEPKMCYKTFCITRHDDGHIVM